MDPQADGADGEVVRQVLLGDRERFAVLVERYQRRIHGFLLRMVRDPARAEDLTQEAFLNAYRALAQFKTELSFKSWLLKIAQNCAYGWLRHRGADPDQGPTACGQDDALPAGADGPSTVVAKGALFGALELALAGLDPAFRSAVLLRHKEELSLAEVASALQVPVGTVKSRLSRAYRHLRDQLAAKGVVAS